MRLALLAGGAFLYLAVFGQWASAMTTLASIAIAVPLGVAGGVLFGILGYRVPLARRIMEPILDLMQTVPIFAYLVPILFLFGFGPVAALIATMIYAMPPMVRVTMTALEAVPREIVEYGTMAGTTRRQMLFKVMLPAARPQLLVGVNQVIMLSLNMVIIASMIGAGGLGYDVLTSLRRLDIGRGLEAGLAIVVLAIALDRLSQAYAFAAADGARTRAGASSSALLAFTAVVYVLGLFVPAVATYPGVAAAFDRAVVGRGGQVVQRAFLRHDGRDQERAAAQRADPDQALHGGPDLAARHRRARLCRLAARRMRGSRRSSRRLRCSSRSTGSGKRRW